MILFSDESRFSLGFNGGRVRVWRTAGERYFLNTCHKYKRTQCISDGVGMRGVGELVVLKKTSQEQYYIRILEHHLFTSVENIFGDRQNHIIFQQDNALAHTARATQEWLEQYEGQTIQSPNLIKHH